MLSKNISSSLFGIRMVTTGTTCSALISAVWRDADTLQWAQSTANRTAEEKDQKGLSSSPKVQAILLKEKVKGWFDYSSSA